MLCCRSAIRGLSNYMFHEAQRMAKVGVGPRTDLIYPELTRSQHGSVPEFKVHQRTRTNLLAAGTLRVVEMLGVSTSLYSLTCLKPL